MAAIHELEVTDAGGTFSIDPSVDPNTIWYLYSNGAVSLSSDLNLLFDNPPILGGKVTIIANFPANGGLDLNGHFFDIDGGQINPSQDAVNMPFSIIFTKVSAPAGTAYNIQATYGAIDIGGLPGFNGDLILQGSLGSDKIAVPNGRIIVGDSGGLGATVAMSGDATLSNTGALTIANSAITNVKVDASAAIARTKLATGTADHVVINSNTGAFSSEAQLDPVRGGTGQDNSASTGFQLWNAGTSSVTAISETIQLLVSFEAAGGATPSVGDFKIKMPYAGTVTGIYAYAVKAIAGTDNGTIVPKNNGGTTMGSGTITFTASDARGTAYTSTPATNNTFAAGDLLTFTTAKTTAGGLVQLSITVTRTS